MEKSKMILPDFAYSNAILACKYNIGVDCTERHKCFRCGWNPAVDKKRREDRREKWLAKEAKKKNV